MELPFEQPKDIESNIKMVERLEHYDVFVLPLPFIPSGSLRRIKKFTSSHILAHARNLELIAIAVYDAVKKIKETFKVSSCTNSYRSEATIRRSTLYSSNHRY